jgi:D-3-phosphoglycerate dehydrogenase
MRVVLCYPVEPRHLDQIRRVLDVSGRPYDLVDAGQERIAAELHTADIYCGHAKVPVLWDEVMRIGRLRWIQSSAAGMDHCLVASVVQSDIPVTSASGVLANQVCDHGLALLLGILRSLPVFDEAKRRREFIRRPTRDLHGARVGIVGLGGNGRRLAEVLAAFRCEVHATDCFPSDKPAHVASLLPPEGLDLLLPELDALVLAAPLNDQTRGMIDARRLALLPQGAVLVNMARGPLVVERDLVDALRSGHLGGAGLDVTEVEPLPTDSPLWDAPNLILTPHVGGQAKTRIDDMTDFFCDNLGRFLRGEPLRNLVDKSLGFPRPEHAAWRRL